MLTVAEIALALHVRPRTIYEPVGTKRIPPRYGCRKLRSARLVELWLPQFPKLR